MRDPSVYSRNSLNVWAFIPSILMRYYDKAVRVRCKSDILSKLTPLLASFAMIKITFPFDNSCFDMPEWLSWHFSVAWLPTVNRKIIYTIQTRFLQWNLSSTKWIEAMIWKKNHFVSNNKMTLVKFRININFLKLKNGRNFAWKRYLENIFGITSL